ncbi:MAG TPA: DUF3078 domain-containing protein [Bacteroidales bacterium]|nr:DUF3078 domain-containing protein [Bacteroidales bacterium]
MRGKFLLILCFFLSGFQVFGQITGNEVDTAYAAGDSVLAALLNNRDTLTGKQIIMTRKQAIDYLKNNFQTRVSGNGDKQISSAIRHLILEASNPPYDSTRKILEKFITDTITPPGIKQNIEVPVSASIPPDTAAKAENLIKNIPSDSIQPAFLISNDSIRSAIGVLLDYLEARDSSLLTFTGTTNRTYSIWLNSTSDQMTRFWLKNDLNDSVTVWIGNPKRDTISLYLEHGVNFRRPMRQENVSQASINYEPQDNKNLVKIGKIITKSKYWTDRTETSFTLNQGMLSNWVKGGESNISTTLDVTWYADYNNKPMLLSSNNFVRLKYGLIKSGDEKLRKNVDLLETNSKINHKAFGKFDFSGIMLFKTQIGKGYNYSKYKLNGTDRDTSILVSKFVNPAILTLGIGLDYKPNKVTSINFSPFSYKLTYVSDTAHIDQVKYGIAKDRRSKHEPGASFLISNEFKPLKTVSVTNRLQLFTNYINNPLNIDVDWEMILQARLNWFTELRLNTHLIFDDDTKTVVLDKEKNPVIGPDGLQKKTARVQFKELLGLSFVFRF